MTCKHKGCNNPVTGKALYCSGACRTKASRASVTPDTPDVTVKPQNVTVEASVTPGGTSTIRTASLEDYKANQQDYATRSEPDKLNWGPWMSAPDLAKAGLRANRVAVQGDWDYTGVGVKGEV